MTDKNRELAFATELLNVSNEIQICGIWNNDLIIEFISTMRSKFEADPDTAEADLEFWREAYERAKPLYA